MRSRIVFAAGSVGLAVLLSACRKAEVPAGAPSKPAIAVEKPVSPDAKRYPP